MFRVYDKRSNTSIEITVFQVDKDSSGYPKFLIFTDKQWMWISAKYFVPVGTEVDEFLDEFMKEDFK